jgi:hypothetical protein
MGESRERYSLAGPYRPARPHQAAPTEGKMADCDEAALGTVDYANSIGVAGPLADLFIIPPLSPRLRTLRAQIR